MIGDNKFQKNSRLLKPEAFRRVFQQATKIHAKGFTLYARANEQSGPRLGLAVAKKSAKRAVDRNRIRRLVRESFRLHQNNLSCFDVVFLSRKEILNQSNAMLVEQLELAWKRLEKQCEK